MTAKNDDDMTDEEWTQAMGEFTPLQLIQSALDALAAAAHESDLEPYQDALRKAHLQEATEEQILDAYHWGRRGQGAAFFDHHGNT